MTERKNSTPDPTAPHGFRVGDYVRFKSPFRGLGLLHPEPRPYLITRADFLISLEGYPLPVPDELLTLEVEANPWPAFRAEWQRFVREMEGGAE